MVCLMGFFVKTPKNPIELNQVMAFLLHGKANSQVKVIHSSHVEIRRKEALAYTLDGENGGKHKKAVIQNHPRQLLIFLWIGVNPLSTISYRFWIKSSLAFFSSSSL